jgi:hypothetical protein
MQKKTAELQLQKNFATSQKLNRVSESGCGVVESIESTTVDAD